MDSHLIQKKHTLMKSSKHLHTCHGKGQYLPDVVFTGWSSPRYSSKSKEASQRPMLHDRFRLIAMLHMLAFCALFLRTWA